MCLFLPRYQLVYLCWSKITPKHYWHHSIAALIKILSVHCFTKVPDKFSLLTLTFRYSPKLKSRMSGTQSRVTKGNIATSGKGCLGLRENLPLWTGTGSTQIPMVQCFLMLAWCGVSFPHTRKDCILHQQKYSKLSLGTSGFWCVSWERSLLIIYLGWSRLT